MTTAEAYRQILPPRLSERVRILSDHSIKTNASFVLYWMHHAVRGHENPALDTALYIANRLRIPVLVYQGLGGYHPYNSDRHHTFIMQGAKDVQAELGRRGVAYAFHLGRNPANPSPLISLARRAALLVTEEFPVPPFVTWRRRLVTATDTPFLTVDCSCIVPMQSLRKSFARAFQFRKQTQSAYASRISQSWQDVKPEVEPCRAELGFRPVALGRADIATLCSQCAIDHSVGPVPHTPGGSRAGYARWQRFKTQGLKDYARLRNDPLVRFPRGVSHLSAYIHHGHVSVFRIAREAAAANSRGAHKFLDELLIWRELAFNFCFHHQALETLAAVPNWARQTLEAHAADKRDILFSWEQLARGRTGDRLWDAAQRSLLIHGELHNNLRMTWGKALLSWTHTPDDALRLMIALNHRYALDGSDPNSYGGILWCLGLFDRPFTPPKPVIGTLRPRPTSDHARRMDLKAYEAVVARPACADQLSVAVVGAGMAGLVAARTLTDHGLDVSVFERAGGPGGRSATRKEGRFRFDHGAQYFTVRDERTRQFVNAWIEQGLVRRWTGAFGVAAGGKAYVKRSGPDRFVGVASMSAVARYLAADLNVAYQRNITAIEGAPNQWRLTGESGEKSDLFNVVVIAAPPPQAFSLVDPSSKAFALLRTVKMLPAWSVMAVFENRLDVELDGVFIQDSTLAWAARNNSKPGRTDFECWVLHGSNRWSAAQLDQAPAKVASTLLTAFFEAIGTRRVEPLLTKTHRWRYAQADNPLNVGCLWDDALQLGLCGDWCQMSRIEGAFLSGMAMAGRVMSLCNARKK
jgi:photolyase PhrII